MEFIRKICQFTRGSHILTPQIVLLQKTTLAVVAVVAILSVVAVISFMAIVAVVAIVAVLTVIAFVSVMSIVANLAVVAVVIVVSFVAVVAIVVVVSVVAVVAVVTIMAVVSVVAVVSSSSMKTIQCETLRFLQPVEKWMLNGFQKKNKPWRASIHRFSELGTDIPTDTPSYRDARTHLKSKMCFTHNLCGLPTGRHEQRLVRGCASPKQPGAPPIMSPKSCYTNLAHTHKVVRALI